MERAKKRDELVAAGVIARQLDGGFIRFGAGVAEVNTFRTVAGSKRGKPLCQLHHRLVIEIGPRHVQELAGLTLDRTHDIRMRMPRRDYCDTRRKVKEAIAVNIFDDCSLATLHHER